ncbi:MAG: ATP-binding protein [Actinomycetota bacterium]
MAVRRPVRQKGSTEDVARAAGIRSRRPVTLSEVDRRRTQLWTISVFVVIGVALFALLYRLAYESLPDVLQLRDVASYVVLVLVIGLVLALLLYIVEKEARLRHLSELLVEERVLSAALSNRLTEISALSELGKAINTTLDLSDVLNLILSSALELLGGTEGSVMLLEDDEKHLQVVSYHGPHLETVMQGRSTVGQGIAGTVAARRVPMLIQSDEVADDLKEHVHPQRGIRSAMSVPLVRNNDLLGVLNLSETEGKRRFSDHDLDALGLFAEHAAIAIGNASLFEKERETIARLEELDQLKSDFVATVSHELKTPLTAIIGAAKTVTRKGTAMAPEQHASFLEMIERQGQRLLRLVEDILTTSQIESGAPRMRRELVDLHRLATEVIQDLHDAKVGFGRTVVVEAEPEPPRAWGDAVGLRHILSNLVENALKYSPPSSKVIVRVIETLDEARLEVSDEGDGISDEKLQEIFDRFRQIDSSSTRRVGGFGLGLFIVKNLVDAHGGRIEVQSRVDVGSTFLVHLPKRESDRGKLLTDG